MSIFNTNLPDRATEVINAGKEQNTALRVGSLFADIISYIGSQEPDWLRNTGGSGGGGGYTTPGALLQSLWQQGNPAANKILKYDGNNWVPIDVPAGGGSGGGISESDVWQILGTDISTKLIPATYLNLSGCLSAATTFWGNTASNNAVTGSLTGQIQFIEFSNGVKLGVDSETNTIKVYRDDLNAAHFYATGGVSALGYSSPGGGGGGGGTSPTLNAILGSINGSTNAVPSFDSSKSYIVLGQGDGTSRNWNVVENSLGRLSNVTISGSVSNGQSLVYRNGTWVNELVSSGGGATSLLGLSDTPNAWSEPNNKQFLRYNNGTWINSDLPAAEANALGVVKPGTGLSVTDGTLYLGSVSLAAGTGTNNNKIQVSIGNASSGWLTVPYASASGSATTAGSANTANSATTAGTCTGNANTATKLADTSTKTIWGQTYWSGGQPQNVDGNFKAIVPENQGGFRIALTGQQESQESFMVNPVNSDRTAISTFGKTLIDVNKSTNSGAGSIELGYFSQANGVGQLSLYGQTISLINNKNVEILNATTAAKGLRIGDAILYWDADSQALALTKVSTTEHPGTVGNFYATGGVSALGMSPGTSSIDAMTFGNLTVNDVVTIGDTEIRTISSEALQHAGWLDISLTEGLILNNDVDIVEGTLFIGNNLCIGTKSTSARISDISKDSNNKLIITVGSHHYTLNPD